MTVDHPDYYRRDTGHEAIDVIEAWGLGFCLGNAVKYIARAGMKGDAVEDLQKARWYLDREISAMEAEADEREAEAEEADARTPSYSAELRGSEVAVVDEDGDAIWIMDRRHASLLAETLRWAADHGTIEMEALFSDGPEASLRGGTVRVRWGIGPEYCMTAENARQLYLAIEGILGAEP